MHERIYGNIVNNNCTIMRAQLTKQLVRPCTSLPRSHLASSDQHWQAITRQSFGVLLLSKWHTAAFK